MTNEKPRWHPLDGKGGAGCSKTERRAARMQEAKSTKTLSNNNGNSTDKHSVKPKTFRFQPPNSGI